MAPQRLLRRAHCNRKADLGHARAEVLLKALTGEMPRASRAHRSQIAGRLCQTVMSLLTVGAPTQWSYAAAIVFRGKVGGFQEPCDLGLPRRLRREQGLLTYCADLSGPG